MTRSSTEILTICQALASKRYAHAPGTPEFSKAAELEQQVTDLYHEARKHEDAAFSAKIRAQMLVKAGSSEALKQIVLGRGPIVQVRS